jgi:hypothetical protein
MAWPQRVTLLVKEPPIDTAGLPTVQNQVSQYKGIVLKDNFKMRIYNALPINYKLINLRARSLLGTKLKRFFSIKRDFLWLSLEERTFLEFENKEFFSMLLILYYIIIF